ncbi:MAG TPA: HPr family phosphocarrier protein [Candidatus Fimivicinus intestinavium]|nr:HPr family phosphocarrier protein [Candidatus Fimivicinus intestinavium]
MYSRKTIVKNRTGLHARPATQFIELAKRFQSRIQITNLSLEEEDNIGNAKSIISVLSLGMGQGSQIEIFAVGEDEQEAVDALIELVDSGFGE